MHTRDLCLLVVHLSRTRLCRFGFGCFGDVVSLLFVSVRFRATDEERG